MSAIRRNIFVIHAWDDAGGYARMMSLLHDRQAGLADYSVPPWKAVPGPEELAQASVAQRISTASAVIVMNSPGLHRRPWSSSEMDLAVEQGKRIIVLQPPGAFDQPIPGSLDGAVYRVAPWRSDVLGKAIRGEYPVDSRTFDIAEDAERRQLVQVVSAGAATLGVVVIVNEVRHLMRLRSELAARGVQLQWTDAATQTVLGHAAAGAALAGGVAALFTEDVETAMLAALAGGVVGGALGFNAVRRAALLGSASTRLLVLDPDGLEAP